MKCSSADENHVVVDVLFVILVRDANSVECGFSNIHKPMVLLLYIWRID